MTVSKLNGVAWASIAKVKGVAKATISKVNGIVKPVGYEDFSTYTEVDAGGKLTIATSKITAANMLRNEDCYVYKDFGAGFFNALDIDFEIFIGAASSTSGAIGGMGLTVSTVNDKSAWGTTDVSVEGYRAATNPVIRLVRGQYAAFDTSISLTVDTLYYATLSRSASSDTMTCTIYSDAGRTTTVDTLSVAGYNTATTYRYLYGMSSLNSSDSFRFDGYIQNMARN